MSLPPGRGCRYRPCTAGHTTSTCKQAPHTAPQGARCLSTAPPAPPGGTSALRSAMTRSCWPRTTPPGPTPAARELAEQLSTQRATPSSTPGSPAAPPTAPAPRVGERPADRQAAGLCGRGLFGERRECCGCCAEDREVAVAGLDLKACARYRLGVEPGVLERDGCIGISVLDQYRHVDGAEIKSPGPGEHPQVLTGSPAPLPEGFEVAGQEGLP